MKTNINDFLHAYIDKARDVKQISIVDEQDEIFVSSNKFLISKELNSENVPLLGINTIDGKLTYMTIIDSHVHTDNSKMRLMLLTDASTYASHKDKLLQTAIITTVMALIFALLTTRLIYYTAIEQSRKEKERLEHLVAIRTKEIELISQTDALTSLWNRRHLEETLDLEFKRARRYKHDMTIMMIDLDHFKRINDTYGHMAGDEVLREISGRIQSCQRETDFIGRYGGEEIVVILPETDLETSATVAENIINTIAAKPVKFESNSIEVTASVGVSTIKEKHHDYPMIFAEADEALYIAKENGRNRVEIFKEQVS